MGTTLSSIHIFSDTAPEGSGAAFRSFSPNWQTCTDDLSESDARKIARSISRHTEAPVLCFSMFDSQQIEFEFFRGGKIVSAYSDEPFSSNKKLYDIPAMVGCPDGQKKRLSAILACADAELKTSMLEEFLGVCLLFDPEFLETGISFFRERCDDAFREYQQAEKALSGKAAPVELRLVNEYPGKLFWSHEWFPKTKKPHFFLHGFKTMEAEENDEPLVPVHFTGGRLEETDFDSFSRDLTPYDGSNPYYELRSLSPSKAAFTQACPPAYRGKEMPLPPGFYPLGFAKSGELLLSGGHRIIVVDESLKIIAKLSIKGEAADVTENYILTAIGSFWINEYDPKSKIFIYELARKQDGKPSNPARP